MFLKIEAGLSVLALVLALTVPNVGSRWFEALERSFGKLARRRGLSVVVVGLTALALRLALLVPDVGWVSRFLAPFEGRWLSVGCAKLLPL